MTQAGAVVQVRPDAPAESPRRRSAGPLAAGALVALAAGLLVVSLLTSGLITSSSGARLEVRDRESGTIGYARAMSIGETFQLTHTHSVTKRPVIETFSVAGDGLALEELWFDEFGPNLPAGPEQLGEHATFVHEDGAYRVLHHGLSIGTVPIRVGSEEVDHVLTFADGERVRLLDIARGGAWIELTVGAR